jgi:uncharacterized membrane protein
VPTGPIVAAWQAITVTHPGSPLSGLAQTQGLLQHFLAASATWTLVWQLRDAAIMSAISSTMLTLGLKMKPSLSAMG